MTLPTALQDREMQKFKDTSEGVAVKVSNVDNVPYVSTINSTNTPILSGATFTGEWESVEKYGSFMVSLKSDVSGTLYIEFSPDGVNADSILTYDITAETNEVHRVSVSKQYARVRYTNNGTNQIYFRLQTIFGHQNLLTSPLNSSVPQDSDAIVTRPVDSELTIAAGLFSGYSIINKAGFNPDVDNAVATDDVWELGGVYTGFPTGAAETVDVFSDSINDTSAGSGARTIRIVGLDANYNDQSETLTLNGTTPVTSVNTYARVHTASIQTSGSSNQAFNEGTITVRHTTTTANVFLSMRVGANQTNSSGYTIPAGYTGFLRHFLVSIIGSTQAQVEGFLWIRTFGASPRLRRPFSAGTNAPFNEEIYGGISLPEKTDVIVRITAGTVNNTKVMGGYDLILVKDQ